ncbi:ABC transporter substrate-binding protein [Rhodococcus sp. SGAir0479]|uniref:ABC transporter substrate-binding protein n=1 Tax=Rhodococcus sp. SGAir0479 TaxID=2567884 RepID=UPI0020C75DD2|nr:ABC transporter substrate-binding protein [Rhodococcus sp. SGAir0479]
MRSTTSVPALDRRAFLRGSGLAAFAVLGAVATTGCASAVAELRSGAAVSGDVTARRGGTVRVGLANDLVAGGILTSSNDAIITTVGLVYETLIRYPGDSLEPQPSLATSWQLAADRLSLDLRLRDDVHFHSGRRFTSADAEFALRTYADPKWTAQLRSTAATITGYDTSDPARLVLTFARPIGNIFDLLDIVPMIDRDTVAELAAGETYIGTGPFVLASRTPNSQIVFERNSNYWRPDRPYLDRVEAAVITDSSALLANVRSGRIDYTGALTYRDANNLTRLGGFSVVEEEGAEGQFYLGTNVASPALQDVRVRRAIAYAVDRERIVDEVFRGAAYPANLPWPRHSPAYDEDRNTTYTLDPDRARALLAEVGELPPIPLTYAAGSPSNETIAQIVQADLAAVGLTVELDPVENAVAVKQLIAGQFPGLWLLTHSFAQYTPATLTVSAYPFNARRNASNFTDADYLAAAEAAWPVSGEEPEALARYRAVNDQLLEHLFLIELAVVVPRLVTTSRLRGFGWTRRTEPQLADAFLA